MVMSNPLFSGSVLMIGGSMGVNVLNYVYHLIMGRLLGPSEYGVLASVYSILYIVSIVPQSASVTIVKFISSAPDQKSRNHIYHRINILVRKVSIVGSVILLLLLPFLQRFLNIQSIWPVVWIIPVYYFSIVTIANQATLQGVLSFLGVVTTNFLSSFVKLALGVILVLIGWAAGGAVFAVGAGVAFSFFLSKQFIKGYIQEPGSDENEFEIAKFIKYSGPVIVQALAFTSLFTVDLILVKHFFPDHDAGLYAALSTLGKVIFFAASPVTAVMFPLVARRKSQKQSGRDIFLFSLAVTAVLSFGIAIVYELFPEVTIRLLYGQKYISAANNLVWMGFFIATYTVCQQLVNFFLSVDWVKIVLLPLAAAITQIILIYFFHDSILTVIKISLYVVLFLAISLFAILGYNRKKLI